VERAFATTCRFCRWDQHSDTLLPACPPACLPAFLAAQSQGRCVGACQQPCPFDQFSRIVQTLSQDRDACALYLFPTKALAQDQRLALAGLVAAAFGSVAAPPVDVYDGDTPMDARPSIRSRARLLITNPDMLHVSILPHHLSFVRFLSKLRYVVVDEGHMYKGAFGCHTACVLRRLVRICLREHGVAPQFVVTSATSADPARHARDLLGVPNVKVVDQDGSPHGQRLFVMWNPPLTASSSANGGGRGSGGGRGDGSDSQHADPTSNGNGRARGPVSKRAQQEAARELMRARNLARSGVVLCATSLHLFLSANLNACSTQQAWPRSASNSTAATLCSTARHLASTPPEHGLWHSVCVCVLQVTTCSGQSRRKRSGGGTWQSGESAAEPHCWHRLRLSLQGLPMCGHAPWRLVRRLRLSGIQHCRSTRIQWKQKKKKQSQSLLSLLMQLRLPAEMHNFPPFLPTATRMTGVHAQCPHSITQ
jgi:DEAD/DEAH box helicase